ncbi:MAG: NADH-quinone oxidoreductase subunit N [Deltaproteobacteria bacterium]|nr:NADH-quinone oxidoreductase subunit N [Candidatus Anaeroferrophillus wilburensis]MBN2889223.1 NADH-quinone oxidoreductase subunit N [Deltaproteobacteria bacterium]
MLEFVVPALNVKAILPQAILALTALTVLLVDVFSSQGKKSSSLGYLVVIGVVAAMISTLMINGARESAYSGMVMVDGFSSFITLIVCVVTLLTVLSTINYQQFFEELNCGEYYCLLLFAAVGMSFMGSASNLLMLFLALETMSISIYVLAGFKWHDRKSIESALKYFLLGAFASGFLLFGFALIFGTTGTMDLVKISAFLTAHPEMIHSRMLMGGVALVTVGFGFKVAMFPFHMWTPDVYEGAPTSVTGFMATGVKAAAFAALVRVFFVALGHVQADWTGIMWLLAFLTMTIGNVVALSQTNIKRMLAYSSIAHAGYLLVGFVAGSKQGQAGILFYLMSYAFTNLGAFGVIALLGKKGGEYTELQDFAGLGFKYPLMGLAMGIFMFSMAGIPPMAGFMGKFYLFSSAMKAGFVWLAIFGVINSVISLYYYLRVVVVMYFQEAEQSISMPKPSPAVVVGLVLAAIGVMQMGIFPSYIWDMAQQSVQSMLM